MLGLIIIITISLFIAYFSHKIYPKAAGGFYIVFLVSVLGGLMGYMEVFSSIGPVIDKVNIVTASIFSILFTFLYSLFSRVLAN